jgi:hypothetical protein
MSNLHNRAGMNTATAGQGTMTLNSAVGAVSINVASFQTFANSGVVDQEIVQYLIVDVNGNWEVGTGTYSSSGPTLTRTVKYSNNSNTAIALSGSAQVFICALSSDGNDVLGGSTNPMRGFDTPVNLQINATSNGSLLTVSVKGNNGADPSPTNPVYIPFRDSAATGGDPIWRIVTSALSINTNATGASLGTSNNTAFRLWVVAFDNAGTVVLALINCSTATDIFPLDETQVQSSTPFTASSTSAGVYYTPNGTTVTSKAIRILGYVEYNSTGLATAGTYATAPNFVQLFGPGIKKPGDEIRTVFAATTSGVSQTAASYATAITKNITPISAANLILVSASGHALVGASLASGGWALFRAATIIASNSASNGNGSSVQMSVGLAALDKPNTTSSTAYTVQAKGDGTNAVRWGATGDTAGFGTIVIKEIMG